MSTALRASAGARLRAAVGEERPLQIVGAINAYTARMAAACGFKALYLSGGGVAANSLGLPDLGISSMDDVLVDMRRITDACDLALLVDADTGWGGAFNIARTVKSFSKFGAAGLHIEDQVQSKRCGHRPGKEIVSQQEMVDRVKAAVDARTDPQFVIMARTDALAVEGVDRAIERAVACVEAGADMIFPEAITELAMYRRFKEAVKVPILANITEFGQTPLYTRDELADGGRRYRPALLLGVSGHERRGARHLSGHSSRRHAKACARDHANPRRPVQVPRLSRLRGEAGRLFAEGKEKHEHPTLKRRAPSSPRNPLRCPASWPAIRRCVPWARPATICTIAAMTFSISPRNASSRKSPTCWCTRSCRTAPSSLPTSPSSRRCACCRPRCSTVLEQLPAGQPSHGRAAHGRFGAWRCLLPEADRTFHTGRTRHRRSVAGLLGSMLCYWYHYANGRPAHRSADRR